MRFRSQVGGKAFKGIDPLGGTLNLPLRLLTEGTDPMHAVTRGYADAAAMSFDASALTGVLPAGRLPAYTGSEISSAGGGLFALQPTGVTAGSYAKVQVNAKGRVVAGDTLVAADIPTLTFSKVVNRPTSLAGYGITDVVSLAGGAMTGPLSLTQAPATAKQLANKAYVDSKVAGGGASPFVAGDIVYKNSTSTPVGYLRCNGAEVSKTTYAGLYAVIGDTYEQYTNRPGAGKPWKQLYQIDTEATTTLGGWGTDPSLPVTITNSQAIVTKNRVYLLGGYINNSPSSTVYTAPILPDGTLGSWSVASPLPGIVYHSQAIVTKNHVYLLGGYGYNGTSSSTVYTAPINQDGTLGSWSTASSLPAGVYYSQAIVTHNRVYLLGGYHSSTVYTAPVLSDGTLGSWTTASALPGPVHYSQAIVTKNRVYLLGVYDNAAFTVYTAPINQDGTLGAWSTASSLPDAVSSSQAIVTKNRVYLLGGYGYNGTSSSTVYTAPILSDGTLGAWSTASSLPAPVYNSQAIVTKNHVYLLGGTTGSGYLSTVYASSINCGLNDYSPYYDGSIIVADGDPNSFRLPDLTSTDIPGSYSYIKY